MKTGNFFAELKRRNCLQRSRSPMSRRSVALLQEASTFSFSIFLAGRTLCAAGTKMALYPWLLYYLGAGLYHGERGAATFYLGRSC